MPAPATLADHAAVLAAATAASTPFHLGVTLSYVGGGSNKKWVGVWADDLIAVNWGMHNTDGQYLLHRLDDRTRAAMKMWSLLRDKVGKGYAVVDAAFTVLSDEDLTGHDHRVAILMTVAWTRLRLLRARNPVSLPFDPDATRSPRTGRQGGQVLLGISDPHASEDTLIAAWDSAPSERFLPPLVLSHPRCPQQARFLDALAR